MPIRALCVIFLKFKEAEPKPPIKAILSAIIMFLVGSILIVVGVLLYTGYIDAQVGGVLGF